MRKAIQFFVLLLAIIVVACGPSEEDKAMAKVNFAKTLLSKQDTSSALLHLDSITKLFPEAIYASNAAKSLMNEVRFSLLQRKESELDTIKVRIAALEKSFEKEKTEFDRYTQYIHKRQTFKRAWDRSYIQIHLDERGDLFLSSNYHGEKWLNHYGLRVYDQGDDAKTDSIPIGNPNNHHSDFSDDKWEKVSYRNGSDNGVIEFIANNTERNLKAVFLGKEYYYIILETYDKEAVKDALALSKALKSRTRLENEIKGLQTRLKIN